MNPRSPTSSRTNSPSNAGTGEHNRPTPDSMEQADRANGEGPDPELDPAVELNDEVSDDPAVTGVQDGD